MLTRIPPDDDGGVSMFFAFLTGMVAGAISTMLGVAVASTLVK